MYLSYFGVRVTDLVRSAQFYVSHFGLRPAEGQELPATPPTGPAAVLLVDPRSSQRLELNYYPPGSPYAVAYVPGEGWDHLAVRVDDLPSFLAGLAAEGIRPESMAHYAGPVHETPTYRVAYIRDPDGNQIELYDIPNGDARTFDPDRF